MNNNHNNESSNYLRHSDGNFSKRTNFTLNSSNSKPFDVNKMTGKPADNQSSSKGEEK